MGTTRNIERWSRVGLLCSAACGGDDSVDGESHPLVGSWQSKQEIEEIKATTLFVFTDDHRLSVTIQSTVGDAEQVGTWSTNGSSLTTKWTRCVRKEVGGAEEVTPCERPEASVTYTIDGDRLTLVNTVEGTSIMTATVLTRL